MGYQEGLDIMIRQETTNEDEYKSIKNELTAHIDGHISFSDLSEKAKTALLNFESAYDENPDYPEDYNYEQSELDRLEEKERQVEDERF